jgi:predicted phosphate transport protein (TIGR00153 family)
LGCPEPEGRGRRQATTNRADGRYFATNEFQTPVGCMRFLSALMPRETRFFDLFDRHGSLIVEGSSAIVELVRDYEDTARRAQLIQRIGDIERSADKITHETVTVLHATFITPFDRNDIHRLISSMDDVLDLMQDAAESMHLFDIQTLPPASLKMAELLQSCCTRVHTGVGLLRSMDNAARALALTEEIDQLESEADAVSRDGISRLFREEQDVRQLIKHKNVYEYLEDAIDKCQDVANVIESVVVENV